MMGNTADKNGAAGRCRQSRRKLLSRSSGLYFHVAQQFEFHFRSQQMLLKSIFSSPFPAFTAPSSIQQTFKWRWEPEDDCSVALYRCRAPSRSAQIKQMAVCWYKMIIFMSRWRKAIRIPSVQPKIISISFDWNFIIHKISEHPPTHTCHTWLPLWL